jgi:hypothetical protein
MWPRIAEILIGIWLIASNLLFDVGDSSAAQLNRAVCGSIIILLSLMSFWPALPRAHLAELAVGAWLAGFAYWSATFPPTATIQSDLLAALLLVNFAVIPSPATLPPRSWREFMRGGA